MRATITATPGQKGLGLEAGKQEIAAKSKRHLIIHTNILAQRRNQHTGLGQT
jgi:hypothetical protein